MLSIDVENTGDVPGKEIVQLYLQDHCISMFPPLKRLVRYTKIKLEPNEKQKVSFKIYKKDLEFYGIDNRVDMEDGQFSLFIDSS